MPTISVESKVFGPTNESPVLEAIWLELMEERLSVADLIRRAVAEQVQELRVRRAVDEPQVLRFLARHYLTAGELADGTATGAVRYGGAQTTNRRLLDPEAEAERALRAFTEGRVILFVDRRQVESPDEIITFAPGSRIVFLRLTPLIGG